MTKHGSLHVPEQEKQPRIDHINLVVKDLPGTTDFFTSLLGFEIKAKNHLEGPWIDKITGLKNVKADFVALGYPNCETHLELLTFASPEVTEDP